MPRIRVAVVWSLLFLSLPASHLVAQTLRITGIVSTADSIPVAARVVLHRVAPDTQGPIDSTLADRRGRFRFSLRPDSGSAYVLSARYAGIEYFSQPVPTGAAAADSGIAIVVYDTSSSAPVSLTARHLVVTRPGEDGSRTMLDIMVLRNDARRTRIATDTLRPTWAAPLPAGSIGLELAESDFSADAVARRGDSVIVVAPIAPGEKQLTVQYLIPARRTTVDLSLGSPGASINVLTEEPDVRVTGRGIKFVDTQTIQGRSFRRWTGVAQPGTILELRLPGVGGAPQWLLPALVATLSLGLLVTGWYLLAHPRGPRAAPAGDVLDRLATLDFQYTGRESETPAHEWQWYLAERERLKAQLEASLAAGSKSR